MKIRPNDKILIKLFDLILLMKFDKKKISLWRLLLQLKKSNKLILFVVNFYAVWLKILSLIIYRKRFLKCSVNQFLVLNKISNIIFFIKNQIMNLFNVIILINFYNEEKLKEIEIKKKNIENSDLLEYPFLVIGSGPGGSITAHEINKKFPGKVAIIESGKYYSLPDSKHPGDEFLKKWKNSGINSTIFPNMINFSSGETMGGGSEINSGLYHEPEDDFFKKWNDKYNYIKISDVQRNNIKKKIDKFVNLEEINNNQNFDEILINTLNKENIDYQRLKKFQKTSDNYVLKNSMTNTILKDYMSANGKIYCNSKVYKIYFKNNFWYSEALINKKKIIFKSKFLFLCCGSIYTNLLLANSKIFKNKKLSQLKKFKFHPMAKLIVKSKKEIQNLNQDVSTLQITEFYPEYIIGNAASSKQFLSFAFTENQNIYVQIEKFWKYMKMLHVTFSAGYGKILNNDLSDPLCSYYFSKSDKLKIREGYRNLIKLTSKLDIESIIPIANESKIINKENIDNYLINDFKNIKLSLSSVHILGGVTSGESKTTITDSFGKVKNCENLYVNDSSLINVDLLKNPQGTIMTIAYRNIENFLNNIKSINF